jgi:NAD(P)-dependent dehydrogenase (short-subunit alcohol dehydrogenase family)
VTKAFLKSIESANAAEANQPQRTILNLASVSTQNTPVTMDSYTISKVALNKFTEFLAAEHPSITSINLDPGMVATDMGNSVDLIAPFLHDTVELAAAGAVWMCSGDRRYLSGRYVSVNWDVDELEARREEIVRDKLLVEAGIRRGDAPPAEELVIQP